MKHGDFTALAAKYENRPGYARPVLTAIARHVGLFPPRPGVTVADIGAGTGKLTEDLLALGYSVVAVEPNDAMRRKGLEVTGTARVHWRAGSAEVTSLDSSSVDWLLMGSSFHWARAGEALPEFHRVLKPGGWFTAVWNPRSIEGNPLHERIERRISEIVPDLKRVSSGGASYTRGLFGILVSTGHFEEPILHEAPFEVSMTPERYVGAWESVNDVQVQAGPDRWPVVLRAIREEIEGLREVVVPYLMRAYTVRRREGAECPSSPVA